MTDSPTKSPSADPARRQGGFADLVGYRLGTWKEDYAEVSLAIEDRHLNRSGVVHGGVLTTLMDTACGYAGCHCTAPGHVRRAMTLSLNSHFVAATKSGTTLTAIGRKTGGGQQIFFTTCEVVDQAGRLIAQGDGVFKYRRGSEGPEGQPA